MRTRGHHLPFDPKTKTRARSHIIADLAYNFLELNVLKRGHWLDEPRRDYGYDAIMFHHGENGAAENGEIRFQLKSTDNLKFSSDGTWIPFSVDCRDLHLWNFEPYPVIFAIFDASNECAFWLNIQQYVDENPETIETNSQSVTLRIPASNKLNLNSIDQFRTLSLEAVKEFREMRRGNKRK